MKLSRLLFLIIALIFWQIVLQHNCYSANWQYVGTDTYKTKAYIDIDTIKINIKKAEIRFWSKYVDPDGSFMEVLSRCDYNDKSKVTLDIIMYDKYGNVVGSSTPNPPKKSYISSDSMLELCLEAALAFEGIKLAE